MMFSIYTQFIGLSIYIHILLCRLLYSTIPNISMRIATTHFLLLSHMTVTTNQPTQAHAHIQAAVPTLFHPYRKLNANQLAVNKGQKWTKPANPCEGRRYCRILTLSFKSLFNTSPREWRIWQQLLSCSR